MIIHRFHTCLSAGRDFQKQITQIFLLVAGCWLSRMKLLFRIRFGIPMFLFVAILLSGLVNLGYAQTISSTELINNAKQYDGKIVIYKGEVIGDIMVRQEYAWVNINDGSNAIGIWIDKDLTKGILYTGSYKTKGDWVEVEGEFHRACAQHGGDLDIHAQGLKKIKEGSAIVEKISFTKRNLAVIFLVILCLILILRILKVS